MTIDEIIAVLQAYKEGKKIEASNSGEWGYCKYPLWDFANWKYRIAPEPTKRYLIVNPEQVAFVDRNVANLELTFIDGKLIEAKVL